VNDNTIVIDLISQKNNLFTIKQLMGKLKRKSDKCIIYKGVRTKKNYLPEIVYIVAINDKVTISKRYIRNGVKLILTKKNVERNSKIEFSCWDFIEFSNGQLLGSNMNMLNDNTKFTTYQII